MIGCFATRWALSGAADSGRPPSPRVRRHVEGCSRCRAFRDQLDELGQDLATARSLAPRPRALPTPDSAPTRSRGRRGVAVVALAGALAAVVVVGTRIEPTPSSIGETSEVSQGEERAADSLMGISSAPSRSVSEAAAPAVSMADTAPPGSDPEVLDTLSQDAKRTLRYVLRVSGLPE